MRNKIREITGYDVNGDFLSGQAIIEAIDYLKADIALLETDVEEKSAEVARLRAALEDIRKRVDGRFGVAVSEDVFAIADASLQPEEGEKK